MSSTEILTLLAVILSLLGLLVSVVHVTFEITMKISQNKNENNKKD